MELKEINSNEFNNFLEIAIPDYARDKINSGAWNNDEALALSEQTFTSSLPEKLKTKNEYLYCISLDNQTIGYVWFHYNPEEDSTAFLYDFLILDSYQNMGYSSRTMVLIEERVRALGATSLALHVFAQNKRAVHVYEKSGFNYTDHKMIKKL